MSSSCAGSWWKVTSRRDAGQRSANASVCVECAVPPADVVGVLGRAVLGVVDQQVGAGGQGEPRGPLGLAGEPPERRGPARGRAGRRASRAPVGDPVADRRARDGRRARRSTAERADLERRSRGTSCEVEVARQVAQAHREERRRQVAGEPRRAGPERRRRRAPRCGPRGPARRAARRSRAPGCGPCAGASAGGRCARVRPRSAAPRRRMPVPASRTSTRAVAARTSTQEVLPP